MCVYEIFGAIICCNLSCSESVQMLDIDTALIPVTKAYLPPLDDYVGYLSGIWERGWVTNNGPLVCELEEKLKAYFDIPFVFVLSSGTVALQIAIKALNIQNEVITTPFSYVATTSSIAWQGATPIFADIDPDTLVLDPQQIEAAITDQTTAIVATHIYGYPCDVDAIEAIAKKHKLSVLYDAAHAFGVQHRGKSLFQYGDISIASFHATKIFHTIEGGAIMTSNPELAEKVSYLRNFGHHGEDQFQGIGINGNCSELHAAMGLSILPHVEEFISQRNQISQWYDQFLLEIPHIRRPQIPAQTEYNYAYYPVIFNSEKQLLAVITALNTQNIFSRRYFYPCLSTLNYVQPRPVPIAEDISRRILCLPMYQTLSYSEVAHICQVIQDALG